MKSVKKLSLGLLLLIVNLITAQTKTITGIVTDQNCTPLPGASIMREGTYSGTHSGIDGKYEIKAEKGDTLIVRFVEMNTVKTIVGDSDVINFVLESNSQLETIVIRGYVNRQTTISHGCFSGGYAKKVKSKKIKIKKTLDKKNPENSMDYEKYDGLAENPFESPKNSPFSTFSVDVDKASYTNIRRMLNYGKKVDKNAVRVEEMINYFKYKYPQPNGEDPISINTEYGECFWNKEHKILKIGIQAKNVDKKNIPPSNLVFLIDVSGSMNDENKLPLVKYSLKKLTKQLRKEDKVSIVVYAGAAGLVLPPTSNKKEIINALEELEAGGSTAGGEGLELAYKVATENFIKNGNNRIIIATDGDFNVGISDKNGIVAYIESKRDSNIAITCLGYGMGNYNDVILENIANKGNGNYAYIDNAQEAQRYLVNEFSSSMLIVAKDVKVQVDFNPRHVKAYRLIGYENRMLKTEDFKNDKIDAGDMGANHSVTALYEIIPAYSKSDFYQDNSTSKYTLTQNDSNYSSELATVKFRYKKPDGNTSKELVNVIENNSLLSNQLSDEYKFINSVAWFGLRLKDSKLIKDNSLDLISDLAQNSISLSQDSSKYEFLRLLEQSDKIGD